MDLVLRAWIAWDRLRAAARERFYDELGEGVISTAIAVLIMALIGLAMWQLFSKVFADAGEKVQTNVNNIG